MIGSEHSCSVISPQMEPKRGFGLGNLGMEWWERCPHANTGEYGGHKLRNATYPASGANAERNHRALCGSMNNV